MFDDVVIPDLPETLEYIGEFGAELILFLPFMHWLAGQGALQGRTIRTYRGMRSFYATLPCRAYEESDQPRAPIAAKDRPAWLPRRDELDFDGKGPSASLLYPDLRSQFRTLPTPELDELGKPILVIHNKYTYEWDLGPANFISTGTLEKIFDRLSDDFAIVYIRHGIRDLPQEFVEDGNKLLGKFPDLEVLGRHDVHLFDDLYQRHIDRGGALDINAFKNALYSRAHRYISVQGGGTHQLALFKGSLLTVLHRCGAEQEFAYKSGIYTFASDPAPLLATCACETELLDALALYADSAIEHDRVVLSPRSGELLSKLTADTLVERHKTASYLPHELEIAKLLVQLPLGHRTIWQRVRSKVRRLLITGSISRNS
jgi:hypothetical protein